jgi:hypothetical protein
MPHAQAHHDLLETETPGPASVASDTAADPEVPQMSAQPDAMSAPEAPVGTIGENQPSTKPDTASARHDRPKDRPIVLNTTGIATLAIAGALAVGGLVAALLPMLRDDAPKKGKRKRRKSA